MTMDQNKQNYLPRLPVGQLDAVIILNSYNEMPRSVC